MKKFGLILILILIFFIQLIIVYTGAMAEENPQIPQGYVKIGENDLLELYFDESNMIIVKDKRNSYLWKSYVDPDEFDVGNVTNIWKERFNSLFNINYTNLVQNNTAVFSYPSAKLKAETRLERIKNGVRIEYYMTEAFLRFSIYIYLDDEGLVIKVPSDEIREAEGIEHRINEYRNSSQNIYDEIVNSYNNYRKNSTMKNAVGYIGKIMETAGMIHKQFQSFDSYKQVQSTLNNAGDNLDRLNMLIAGDAKNYKGISYYYSSLDKKDMEYILLKQFHEDIKKQASLITVLLSKIKGFTAAGIVSLDILPFFGSAGDNAKGYVFYPDGCGALYHFKKDHPSMNTYFNKTVYNNIKMTPAYSDGQDSGGFKNIMLPVYGVKKYDNAFLAFAEDGDAASDISFYPSGLDINVNRANITFLYRNTVNSLDKLRDIAWYYQFWNKEMMKIDHSVKYLFLQGSNADYSGMADKYRSYLLKTDQVKATISKSDRIPLGLDIFMGIIEERILVNKYIAMTTFKETKSIVEELTGMGVGSIRLNLLGWTRDGYGSYPSDLVPHDKLGGEKELSELVEYLKPYDIDLYLNCNFVDAVKGQGNFSIGTDVVRNITGNQLTDRTFKRFILSPLRIFEKLVSTQLTQFESYGVNGLTFDRIGSTVYFDEGKKNSINRQETSKIWSDMLGLSSERLGKAAVYGGNKYVLKYADWLMNIPDRSTGYFFTDEDVPFIQMVVHGLIPYSYTPVNSFYDKTIQKLRLIEYGYMPYYQITCKDPVYLKNTSYDRLFSSEFTIWKEDIIDMYSEFNKKLGSTSMQYMIKHEKVANDLYKITYSGGTAVYVNYSDSDRYIGSLKIGRLDYVVVR